MCTLRVHRRACLRVHQGLDPGPRSAVSSPGSGCVDVRVRVWVCASVLVSGPAFVSVSVCLSVSVCVGGGVRSVAASVRACVGCLCMYVCRGWVSRATPQTAVCKHSAPRASPTRGGAVSGQEGGLGEAAEGGVREEGASPRSKTTTQGSAPLHWAVCLAGGADRSRYFGQKRGSRYLGRRIQGKPTAFLFFPNLGRGSIPSPSAPVCNSNPLGFVMVETEEGSRGRKGGGAGVRGLG